MNVFNILQVSELLQFWGKGKIRAGQDGVSTGRAQALVFVCELKTGGTKSLYAPVQKPASSLESE
jgi:hypothetical protein